MRFTARTDYSLRMLMYLAGKRPEKATIQEISTKLCLSQDHLMRVAADLSRHGFLTTATGRSGGVSLARDVKEITVGQVVRAIEPDFFLVACYTADPARCTLEVGCRLKGVLREALDAFFAELDKASLHDLVRPDNVILAYALGLPPLPQRPW